MTKRHAAGGSIAGAAGWAAVPLLGIVGAALLPGAHALPGAILLLAAAALHGVLLYPRRGDGRESRNLSPRLAWPLLAAVVVAAAAARLWRLDSLPEGFWYDEAEAGLEGLWSLRNGFSIFARTTDNTALMYWIVAAAEKVLGPTVAAVRLVAALSGIGVVIASAMIGREIGGRGCAVAAGWAGAVMAWGITFSRLGMPYMTGAFFLAAALALMLRATRTGRRRDWAGAGIVLGAGHYSYTTFRIILPVAALHSILLLASRGRRRATAACLALFWICAAAVSAPLVAAAVRHPEKYFGRIREASVFSPDAGRPAGEALRGNLSDHLLMFHVRGDPNGRHNLPGRPMLDPVTGVGLILGLASLARLPWRAASLMAITLLGGLAAGVFSLPFESPQAARTSGIIPVVAVLAGLGWWTWFALRPASRRGSAAGALVLALLAAGSGAVNARWYFHDQAGDPSSWSSHSPGPTWAARRWNSLAGPRMTVVDPVFKGQRTIEFLAPAMNTDVLFDPARGLPLDPARGTYFLALSGYDARYREVLAFLYPSDVRTVSLSGAGTPVDPAGRGLIETLAFRDRPEIQAITATIPERVARGKAGFLAATADGRALGTAGSLAEVTDRFRASFPLVASTLVNLRQEGEVILRGAHGGSAVAVDGLPGPRVAEAGLHLVAVTLRRGEWTAELAVAGEDGRTAALAPLYAAAGLPPGWTARYRSLEGEGHGFSRFEWMPDRYVHLLPLPRPYQAVFRGVLEAPRSGEYTFWLKIIGRGRLEIAGATVVEAGPRGEAQGNVALREGSHSIMLSFVDDRPYAQIYLDWLPPGGERSPLPYGVVTPQ